MPTPTLGTATPTDLTYRHALPDDDSIDTVTLCGITEDPRFPFLPIACDCGQCGRHVTCPACLTLLSGVVS